MAKRSSSRKKPEYTRAKKAPPRPPVEEAADPADHHGVADRATLLEWLRSELVGPQLLDLFPRQVQEYVRVPQVLNVLPLQQDGQDNPIQVDPAKHTVLFHKLNDQDQEIIWYRESPRQRYGTGLL